MSADNDSVELEALFDSLSGDFSPPPVAAAPTPAPAPDPAYAEAVKKGDDAELEALFDQVASNYRAPDSAASAPAAGGGDGGLDSLFFDELPAAAPVASPSPAPAAGGDDLDGLFFDAAPGLPGSVVAAPPPVALAMPKSDLDDLFFDSAPGLPGSVAPAAAPPAAKSDLDDFLFDSAPGLPGGAVPAPVVTAPAPAPVAGGSQGGDSDALEALFDQVSAGYQAPQTASQGLAAAEKSLAGGGEGAFNRIGHMARQLHDTLMDLGYDKMLEDTMRVLPDAQDRLSYVANLTEKAACKVLNATDIAKPIVDDIESTSRMLGARWDAAFANQLSVNDFKALAEETRLFLRDGLPKKAEAANAQLLEIMMAQDFQDLTGQVIKRVVTLAQGLESGLMAALVELMPDERRSDEVDSLLNGPVINPGAAGEVVVNQEQVDDLLDSLGF